MNPSPPPIVAPGQLTLRFGLELAAMAALGAWARHAAGPGWAGIAAGLGLSVSAAVAWGTFAVAHDPSRSGHAPIVVPGWLRLLIELTIFLGAAVATAALHRWLWCVLFVTLLGAHHVATESRIRWLLRQ